ncbi:MAG TPA: CDP-alcohol phosphatidyltransferase family protein [Hanamia sp.]|nr:CDP-alcohol phosphatidyltransferase family protein [Hanamia sp.]
MNKRIYYIVNGITIYRIVAAPLLVLLIIYKQMDWFKWLLALSFFTDAIDGYLARRFNVTSIAGARLDSIGDDLTIIAGTIGMIVFKPTFLKHEIFLLILLLSLFALQTVLAFIKFGKMTSFHTYAAKASAILQGVFLILLFFLPNPLYELFYAALILTAFQLIEEIIITLWLPKWETNVKGLYWIIKSRRKKDVNCSFSKVS